MKLNDAQQSAVNYVSGPCLVLAGAGSGKTRVITTKIVSLIRDHNIAPVNILAVTFTNKAAAEMRERVKKEIGKESAGQITISTFHSLGLNILKVEYASIGLSRNFTLFDQYDSLKVIKDLVRENYPQLLIDNSEKEVIEDIANDISNFKSSLLRPEDIKTRTIRVEIYDAYEKYLQACNAADFEDLIFKRYEADIFDVRSKVDVFFTRLLDEETLTSRWKEIRNCVALNQLDLDDEFERWNFYLFYVVDNKAIDINLKYEIEHDTISSRKMVVNATTVDDELCDMLIKKYIKYDIENKEQIFKRHFMKDEQIVKLLNRIREDWE